MTKIQQYGRPLESDEPSVDSVVCIIKRMDFVLARMSDEERIQQEVRNFCSQLRAAMSTKRRFETLSTFFNAAALLNPDKSNRDMMSSDEKVEARSCLETLSERVNTRDSIEVTDVYVIDTDSVEIIEVICRESISRRAEPLNMNFEEELRSFENTIDEKMSAFFFSNVMTQELNFR